MATKVNQPTLAPTNKLTGATFGAFLWAFWKALMVQLFPDFGGDYLYDAAVPLFVYLGGFVVRDDANVTTPVVVSTPATESANGPA